MTVKELKDRLDGVEDDLLVVLAIDAEGNGFKVLGQTEVMMYGDGEVGLAELTEDAKKAGYGEEDVKEDGVLAMVLWP